MSDPGYLWYNLFGLFYTQGFPMTPAFPDPFFPLAPCLCVRTRYRKRPPGARDAFSEAFGTGEGLLRYGIRIRCSKWLPGVRDAFSEAFGVKNWLFRYGRDIRYRKRPPTVRNEATGYDYSVAGSGGRCGHYQQPGAPQPHKLTKPRKNSPTP